MVISILLNLLIIIPKMKKLSLITSSLLLASSLSSCGLFYKKDYDRYADKYIKKADLNKDGFVSKKENKKYSDNKFSKMDSNKDKKISKEEIKDYKKSQCTKHKK